MLAPTGARRTKADHPALPITIAEIVAAAKAGFDAGAEALHAHVRDSDGRHCLDSGLYRELIGEMETAVPGMPVQITTEAAGMYGPDHQRKIVREVMPEGVSVVLREMWPGNGPAPEAQAFYLWAAEAGISMQHILFTREDATRLAALVQAGWIPGPVQCLLVLGSYTPPVNGSPEMLHPLLSCLAPLGPTLDWAVCCFGAAETACLQDAMRLGGKIRVGFENNLTGPDLGPAADNAARVRDVLGVE
jgi:uncharacterized protein (DUF849 family)